MRRSGGSWTIRIGSGLLAAGVLLAIGACGGSSPSFPIADAHELLAKTVDRQAALGQVHLDVNLVESGGFLGGPDSGRVQADVDIANSELQLTGASSEVGAAPVQLTIADGRIFTFDGRTRAANPLDPGDGPGSFFGVDKTPYVDALRAIAIDARIVLEKHDGVDCAAGKCYSVTATIPPQVLFEHLGPVVGPVLGLPDQLPPDVPAVSLLFLIEPTRLDVVHAELVFVPPSRGRAHLVVDATNHDQPLSISAP